MQLVHTQWHVHRRAGGWLTGDLISPEKHCETEEDEFEQIVHLVEDMLQCSDAAHYGQIELNPEMLDSLLDEIQDPAIAETIVGMDGSDC